MENATKALLMAAGILVGIMILSLAVYLFTDFGTTSAEINKKNAEQQIVEFNTQYSTYLNRDNLTIYDVVTVANMANENNQKYKDVNNYQTDYKITVYLDNAQIQDFTQDKLDEKIKNSTNTVFECKEIGYYLNTSKRVSYIKFNTK